MVAKLGIPGVTLCAQRAKCPCVHIDRQAWPGGELSLYYKVRMRLWEPVELVEPEEHKTQENSRNVRNKGKYRNISFIGAT
eukprot:1156080-Pelagomonas_calceolata.AAC.4